MGGPSNNDYEIRGRPQKRDGQTLRLDGYIQTSPNGACERTYHRQIPAVSYKANRPVGVAAADAHGLLRQFNYSE